MRIATTNPKITRVSGITVKINPFPNNSSFSARAPTAAVPIDFSAIALAIALKLNAILALNATNPTPILTYHSVLPPIIVTYFFLHQMRQMECLLLYKI